MEVGLVKGKHLSWMAVSWRRMRRRSRIHVRSRPPRFGYVDARSTEALLVTPFPGSMSEMARFRQTFTRRDRPQVYSLPWLGLD
jgi:hypothetical protein